MAILTLSLLILQSTAMAATPEEKGVEIAMEIEKREKGFGDFTADLLMVLKNRHGQASERSIRLKSLEMENDGDKGLTIFDNPKDVKGTAFLTFTHKVGDDDQWLYLPALKRVKRISSRNKSGSFMGSEFSYEDFSSQEIEKYEYKWMRDEVYNELECLVVEYYPVDKNSGYTKQVNWIDKAEYRVWKVEFYDKKNSHLKTLTLNSYERHSGKYWKAGELEMMNHQNGKSTILNFSNYSFNTGLKESDFSRNALKRAR